MLNSTIWPHPVGTKSVNVFVFSVFIFRCMINVINCNGVLSMHVAVHDLRDEVMGGLFSK